MPVHSGSIKFHVEYLESPDMVNRFKGLPEDIADLLNQNDGTLNSITDHLEPGSYSVEISINRMHKVSIK